MNSNPLNNQSYINKDFQTIYPELLDLIKKLTYKWDPTISNESDPGVLLIKLNAIIADKNNYNIDKNLLECFPDTVTQEGNATKLFDQLGYSMHWYKSAEGSMSMRWGSEKLGTGDHIYSYEVPQFTMVCDDSKEIVYTLLDSVELSTNGTTQHVDVLQGVILDYSFGSTKLLNRSMLDYKNRLYFPIPNVAENGIFISDAVKNLQDEYVFTWHKDMDGWKKVDNLHIQPLGTKCYKFGIDQLTNSCYVEFPSDISDLMGEGIFLKYLQTSGKSGNIAAKRIKTFYSDLEYTQTNDLDKPSRNLAKDVLVWNNASITNGKDVESIDEAYVGYKRQVGTFDTLVTLRDYLNYIVNEDFRVVSNGVIADRNNDIQSTYRIVTNKNGFSEIKTLIDNDDNGNPQMTPYDLKTYLLNYSELSKFSPDTTIESQKKTMSDEYNKSFELKLGSYDNPLGTPLVIETYFNDAKSISHDFISKLPNKPLFFKNKFALDLVIVPNSMITQAQADSIEKNVYEALYSKFMSRNISFGKELSYESVYDVCTNADTRIKAVALENLTYDTYAVVYLEEEDKEKGYTVGLNELLIPKEVTNTTELEDTIALDIAAKNVLAGVTPMYCNNDLFKLDVYQKDISVYKEVTRATTNTEITFNNLHTNQDSFMSGVTLGDNEAIILYAPNLIEGDSYATSTKYVYFTDNSYVGEYVDYLPANRDITLQQGQHLYMFWKLEDSADAPYQYAKYGKGTIIHSTTRINESKTDKLSTIKSLLQSSGYSGEGQILGELNDLLYDISDTILSASKNITIKRVNSAKLNDTKNDCYWITNDVHTTNGKQQYRITFEFNDNLDTYVTDVSHYSNIDNKYFCITNFDMKTPYTPYTLKDNEVVYILKQVPVTVKYQRYNYYYQQLDWYSNKTDYFNYEIVAKYKKNDTISFTNAFNKNSDIDVVVDEEGNTDNIITALNNLWNGSKLLKWGTYGTTAETTDEATQQKIEAHQILEPDEGVSSIKSSDPLANGFRINKLILNNKVTKSGLENSTDTSIFTYRLKTNEYFIYTNDNRDDFNILESGTTINIEVPDKYLVDKKLIVETSGKVTEVKPIQLSVNVSADVDTLQSDGIDTFTDEMWYQFTAKGNTDDDGRIALKDNGRASRLESGTILEIVENQIIKLGAGDTIEVKLNAITNNGQLYYDPNFANLKIDSDGVLTKSTTANEYIRNNQALTHYQIRYKSSTDDSYTLVPVMEDYNLSWSAYTILNINTGPNSPQKLNSSHSQKIRFDLKSGEQADLGGDVYIQTDYNIILAGGQNINMAAIDANGKEYYADAMVYSLSTLGEDIIKDGNTYLVAIHPYGTTKDKPEDDLLQIPLDFLGAMPEAEDGSGILLPIRATSSESPNWKFDFTHSFDTSGDSIFPIGYTSEDKYGLGIYYFNFDSKNYNYTITNYVESYDGDGEYNGPTLSIKVTDTEKPVSVQILPPVAYNYNTKLNVTQSIMEEYIKSIDTSHLFDYGYSPLSDDEIKSPLESKSFFNKSHICNEFTIPQIASISIKVMNKRN